MDVQPPLLRLLPRPSACSNFGERERHFGQGPTLDAMLGKGRTEELELKALHGV